MGAMSLRGASAGDTVGTRRPAVRSRTPEPPNQRTPAQMPTRRISGARHVVGDVLVLVGTTKGAFIFTADESRKRWRVDGPHFPGEAVYSLAFDQRAGRTRLFAGVHSNHWGATIRTSDDFGRT